MSEWKKVPSVTTGGKPFFWVKNAGTKECVRISWDRMNHGWRIWKDNDTKKSAMFRTPQEAIKAERINPDWKGV